MPPKKVPFRRTGRTGKEVMEEKKKKAEDLKRDLLKKK